jgi:hypothetical protein
MILASFHHLMSNVLSKLSKFAKTPFWEATLTLRVFGNYSAAVPN